MQEMIKILLGITDDKDDDLIKVLIELCEDEAMQYCNTDIIDGLETAIVQMVIFKYNRIGTEGLNSENYNSANFSYMENYPTFILSLLKKHRKMRII